MKHSDYIAIIDYQLSNMFSVKHVFDHLGVPSVITSDPQQVVAAKAAVLPGVGAFGDAMKNLTKFGLTEAIGDLVKQKKSLLGVCLGLQLFFSESEEFGRHAGLNLIAGTVRRFPEKNSQGELLRVPQIGWNTIYGQKQSSWQNSPLQHLKDQSYMYFVHSYYVKPADVSVIVAETDYQGFSYVSAVARDKLFAVQFHPEKSGPLGVSIYRQWLDHFV